MYDFDKVVDRRGTSSIKWNVQYDFGQKDGLLPFWIADTDFASEPKILEAIQKRCDHPVIGYADPWDSVYEAIQGWWDRRHGWKPETDWLYISTGVVTGIYYTLNVVVPKGGKVLCGVAYAESPLGPFVKDGAPVMENPENPWSVEDPYIWTENGKYYALVKDFHGYFTKTDGRAVALFTSDNGHDWACDSKHPLALRTRLNLGDREEDVFYLERPQLFFEDGKCKLILLACMEKENDTVTYNIRIPLKY